MSIIATTRMVEEIRAAVTRSASRWRRLVLAEALGLAVALPLAYLWLVFLADNWLKLPVAGRLAANVVFFAGLGWLLWSVCRRWKQTRLSEDEVALAMERRTAGGVQNRLINALQLSRESVDDQAGFRQAVVQENYERLKHVHLEQAAQARPALLRVTAAAAMVLVGLALWALRPQSFENAAKRFILPLADIDPLYRTRLRVEPGDVEAMGDVSVQIHIDGAVPAELVVLRETEGGRSSQAVPVRRGARTVTYTFTAVDQSLRYAVRGNDYTTPYYRIDVPLPSTLSLVRVNYRYPAYTDLPAKAVESAGGDLEALIGTTADVTFVFDEPTEEAALLLHMLGSPADSSGSAGAEPTRRVPLQKRGPREFAGQIVFRDVTGYQLATRRGRQKQEHASGRFGLRMLADKEPTLELAGVKPHEDVHVESSLPLEARANDDYGLVTVGLFARRRAAATPEEATEQDAAPAAQDDGWQAIEVWDAAKAVAFNKEHELVITGLGVAEGDAVELALRAIDTDPLKRGTWVTGTPVTLVIGGDGVTLQVTYEQILKSEAELERLLAAEQAAMEQAKAWMGKLDAASGLRWDDRANLDALAAAMKAQAKVQETIRQAAGQVARDMVPNAGNLKMSVGMLADTEMVRAIRVLEAVPGRDSPQDKRAALGDGRLAQERTLRSLREILGQYVAFRQDWELAHMIPFVKMIADRQAGLRDESGKLAASPGEKNAAARRQSAERRQHKLADIADLARTAFDGLVPRLVAGEEIIRNAFTAAAAALGGSDLRQPMAAAAAAAVAGQWAAAQEQQAVAARKLLEIHVALVKAQAEAAAKALAGDRAAASQVRDQAALKQLREGEIEDMMNIDGKDPTLAEQIVMREQQQKSRESAHDAEPEMYLFEEAMKKMLQGQDTGKRQQFENLSLADTPGGERSFPNSSDREGNKVTPFIQEEFKDLVGPLLEEADKLSDKYETYNLNMAANIDEPGAVGKQAGDINSTAAGAATGNQKQPTADFGGASRVGRQGARAHGMAVGSESIDRRGRDQAQEGSERSPEQAGVVKQTKSDDPQKDVSTGMGGRRVETDELQTFNVSDAGEFTEDMAKRIQREGKIKDRTAIVERRAGKLDPRIAEMLRDLESDQEQVIERIKAIKKELKELYLPTEQFDELEARLMANLERLKEAPDADLFKLQQRTLDELRATVRVFAPSATAFAPSLPRDQAVRGPVLDEPARQAISGYEEAVKLYYEKLARP